MAERLLVFVRCGCRIWPSDAVEEAVRKPARCAFCGERCIPIEHATVEEYKALHTELAATRRRLMELEGV